MKPDGDSKILREMFGSVRSYKKLIERERLKRKGRRKRHVKLERPSRPPRTTHDYPYLKPIDIPKGGTRDATIIGQPKLTQVKFDDELKERYRMPVQFENGEKRRWTMARSASDHLLHEFGKSEMAWIGKRIRLMVKVWKKDGERIEYLWAEPIK